MFSLLLCINSSMGNANEEFEQVSNVVDLNKTTGASRLVAQTSIEEGVLTAEDKNEYEFLGLDLSLSGKQAIVGVNEGFHNGVNSGAAYVFRLNNGVWTKAAKLVSNDYAEEDKFGSSVSISGDRVLVGAKFDDDNGDFSGSAYVFELVDGVWTQTTKLTASDASAFAQFGTSVSLYNNRALVSAPLDSEYEPSAGAVYVFEYIDSQWSETVKLTPKDLMSSAFFGASLSLQDDRALISAPAADGQFTNSGAAYIFDMDSKSGLWSQTQKLIVTDVFQIESVGYTVSLSGDRALLGTSSEAAFVFELRKNQWLQTSKITKNLGTSSSNFGKAVSLLDERAMIGDFNGLGSGNISGEVVVFDLQSDVWTMSERIYSNNSLGSDDFGWSLSQSASRVLIGAPNGYNGDDFSGLAYVFNEDVIFLNSFD